MNVAILGAGKMGEALIMGLKDKKTIQLSASTHTEKSAKELQERLGIQVTCNNEALIQKANVIVLCVKPHQVEPLLKKHAKHFKANQLLISICAGVTLLQLQKHLKSKTPVIRAMTNTPALVGTAMTVLSSSDKISPQHLHTARMIFQTLGRVTELEEELMDGVTGLSGCGPAYMYLIIEALSEAGVKVGIPRKTSTLLAAQTMLGSAKMVLNSESTHPAALKDEVTTPAGCTIDGLMALEEGKLRVAIYKAVLAATKRSKKLT